MSHIKGSYCIFSIVIIFSGPGKHVFCFVLCVCFFVFLHFTSYNHTRVTVSWCKNMATVICSEINKRNNNSPSSFDH